MTAKAHRPVISVMLAVPDAAVAARWYAHALGATELWNVGVVVGVTVAGAPFFLGEPESNGLDTPAALGSRTVRRPAYRPRWVGACSRRSRVTSALSLPVSKSSGPPALGPGTGRAERSCRGEPPSAPWPGRLSEAQ